MPDYKQGKIYVIKSRETDEVYYGSTTKALDERLRKHRNGFQNWINHGSCGYISSYEIVLFKDSYIELVENVPCNTMAELRRREGEIILSDISNCVNKQVPGQTRGEYYRRKRRTRITCDCGAVVGKYSLSAHRKTKKHLKYITSLGEGE
jgi:hypothetical protein